MRYLFFIPFLFIVINSSCNKEDVLDQGFMVFRETKCSNPWGNTKNISEIKDYLESEGLYTLEIKREENSKYSDYQPCESCLCLSGSVVLIRVDYDNTFKALEMGFTTINGEIICG